MIKLEFSKIKLCPKTKIDLYDSVNRIPLSIALGSYSTLPSTIYSRNSDGENFIEFRFNSETKNLYEICLIAIQNDSVEYKKTNSIFKCEDYYMCNIVEENNLLENFLSMKIKRFYNSVSIEIGVGNALVERQYCIGQNCYVGVNKNSYLTSVTLSELTEENVSKIFE